MWGMIDMENRKEFIVLVWALLKSSDNAQSGDKILIGWMDSIEEAEDLCKQANCAYGDSEYFERMLYVAKVGRQKLEPPPYFFREIVKRQDWGGAARKREELLVNKITNS